MLSLISVSFHGEAKRGFLAAETRLGSAKQAVPLLCQWCKQELTRASKPAPPSLLPWHCFSLDRGLITFSF